MSKSYLTFGSRGCWQSDGIIECWLYAMTLRLQDLEHCAAVRNYWAELCRYGWTGTLDPDFERFLRSDGRVSQAIVDAAGALANEDFVLTASELNREHIGGPKSIWNRDVQASDVRAHFAEIAALISSESTA